MSDAEGTFPARLKAAMATRGMTPEALSDEVGEAFSPRTIFRWRGGQAAPGIDALPLLCKALGVTADWLLGSETPAPADN